MANISSGRFQTMWVFCAGMRRSGSVLQYHIARDAAKEIGGVDLGWIPWQEFDKVYKRNNGKAPMAVVKSHTYLPEHSDRARDIVAGDNYKVITIYRDLRDVVASSKRMWKLDIRLDLRAIQHEFNSWSSLPNTLVTRYEDIALFVYSEVMRIRKFLNINYDPESVQRVAWKYEKENMRQLESENTDKNGYSTTNHMWPGHVGSGKIGRWRNELTGHELSQIDAVAGGWQRAHGYVD